MEISTALSAHEALEMLKTRGFDVIVSDYEMPQMNGIEFLRAIKETHPHIPFIIFTGRGREHVAIEALNLGAAFYLQKGGHPRSQFAELRNMIEQAVSRKRAELALQRSEQRLSDIINFLPDATFAIDREGRVIAWNYSIEEMTGVPAREILGKGNYEYSIPFYSERRPILIDLIFESSEEIVKRYYGVVHKKGDLLIGETDLPRLGGQKAILWGKASPLYDHEGNIIGAIESIRDVSERRRMEEALKESEARYKGIVESQEDLIARFLPDGTYIFVNPAFCRYYELSYDEIVGSRFRPHVPPEEMPLVRKHFASLTPKNPTGYIQHRIILPGGEVRWQSWTDQAIFDEKGGIREFQSVGRDITDVVKAEEAVQMANRKLSLLSRITRHDILNQVTALMLYLDMAKEQAESPWLVDFIEKIQRVGQNIERQVAFTKEYEDIGVRAPTWQDMNGVLQRALQSFDLSAIRMHCEVGDLEVYADPLLERVFHNLVDNAMRHGDGITAISISTTMSSYGLILSVEDDGSGIPHEEKEKIFEKGYGKGSGFGLFLAREILDITGISLIETGEPGTGARFEVFFPKGTFRSLKRSNAP
ncbi:MAG: Bacterioopsin transcriptional activator [Methanoregulaceae archaeon PtaB.Bin009]|jgi:PAS domain S-box-containing protein|nr:MAG: Bacterioopsin transcriptional activator [Methanoregulaceae archaeon PtaB.Bin009]